MPPYVPGNLPPHASTGPIYGGGYPSTGPVLPPQGPDVIWPDAAPPPAPDKPRQGPPAIAIGDGGWTLQYWRGVGWVVVPPDVPPPSTKPPEGGIPPAAQPKK